MLRGYTIFRGPDDYPGKVVVRGWSVHTSGRIVQDERPIYIGDSIDEARAKLPAGLVRVERSRGDVASILEVWL